MVSLFPLHARPHGVHQVGEPWARALTGSMGETGPGVWLCDTCPGDSGLEGTSLLEEVVGCSLLVG